VVTIMADSVATNAAVAAASMTDSSSVLSILLLCGLMGLLGQGARAAVGLKTMTTSAASAPTQQTEFNAAYLLISLMIGFIAGILAGLAVGLSHFKQINLDDAKVLIGIAVAGYAGTDFIENTLSIFIPNATKPPPPAATQDSGAGTALNTNVQALSSHVNRLADTVTAIQTRYAASAAPAMAAAPPAADVVPGLAAAFGSCAPLVHTDIWVPPLSDAFSKYDLGTNRRMAAAIGQFLVEAGAGFQEVVENLHYSTAARIHQIFPNEFPTVASAMPYVNNPQALGNRAYANKGGNGDEASGDGYRFCGRGLIQLTGRNEYAEFGTTVGMTAEQAAQYCETPAGAAMSGCWYLSSRGCLPLADVWALSKITRKVNGAAMLDNNKRIAYSNAFLSALGN
jgi:predicted chitinase